MRHLATGGMARVYLARVTGIGGFERHVVVKTIPPDRSEDARFVGMFLDEARLLATLHHQHVAQAFELGQADDGRYFFAMEYVHGETVRQLLHTADLRRITLPLELGMSIVCAAAAGLHHAHERRDAHGKPLGIVHRDVSPSNVVLGYDGSIKLIDFGIAKARTRTTETAEGVVKGKAGYMAPEQARGYAVDRRSDVFALGVLAYELMTQTRAFHTESQFETLQRTLRGEVELPSKRVAMFPPALEDVIMTALEVDPDDRFQDADAMRIALEQVASELHVSLGTTPVIRALDQVFPDRREPWLADVALDDETTPIVPISDPVIVVVPRTVTPRLARGTEDPTRDAIAQPIVDIATRPFVRPRSQEMAAAPAMLPLPPRRPTPTPMPAVAAELIAALEPSVSRPSKPILRARSSAVVLPLPQPESPVVRPTLATSWGPRRIVAIVAAALAVFGLTILLLVVGRGHDSKRSAIQPTPPAPAPVQPALPPPPPPTTTPPPAPTTQVADGTILLHVTTEPVGATVVLDGVRLGVTPLSMRVHSKGAAWLKVRKRGFVPVRTRMSMQQDVEWDVALRELFH